MGSRRWSNVTKIVVVATLAILAIILMVAFRAMIAPTVVAFLLAFILSYPVNWIQRSTGWARGAAVTVIYIVLLLVVSVTPVLVVPRLMELVTSLRATLEELVTNLQTVSPGPLLAFGPIQLSLNNLFQQTGEALSNILLAAGNPFTIARGLTTGVLTVVYVLVLNFWILKDLYKLQRIVLENIPTDYQEDARRLGSELGQIWHAFLRGQLALAISVGLMTWFLLALVGMPNAGGLAVLAGFMEFLPSIGPGISGIIGTAVALYQGSTWIPVNNIAFAIVVLIVYSIIAQIESIYLIPRLVGGRVRLHPAVTFVGIISGTIVFGLLGVLLATPMIASARAVLAYIYRKLLDLEPFEPIAQPQVGVRIPGLIAGRKIEAVILDLDGTVTAIDWRAADWAANHAHWLDRVIRPELRYYLTRRLMVALEGFINFIISQLQRYDRTKALVRLQPTLNALRGFPPACCLQPLPEVVDSLRTLSVRYQLALASTRTQAELDCFFHSTQFDAGIFTVVSTREDVRNQLPHSEALLLAAEQMSLEANQILVVSDSDVNLRSARAAQMATAGVLSGLGEEKDLEDADIVLPSAAELVDWL